MAASEKPLNGRQLAFARAYAKLGNAEQAAIEAGYAANSARKNAADRLLRHPGVAAEIRRLQDKAAARAELSIAQVLDELKLIAFADMHEFARWNKDRVELLDSATLDAARRRAVVEVSQTRHGIRIKLADKLGALDKLGKHLGMFVEKVEHSGEIKNTAPTINLTLTTAQKKGEGDG